MSDEALLQLIRDDNIDVLVEVRGHMGGHNRFAVFARRAAPVQVAFLGYPNTTGVRGVDYRITDDLCDPLGLTERLHREKLVRLKRGFLCFQPSIDLPPLEPDPAARNGHITFGSFNNPVKVTPAMQVAWARILSRVPESRLVVKYLRRFADNWLREQSRRHSPLPTWILGGFSSLGRRRTWMGTGALSVEWTWHLTPSPTKARIPHWNA